MHYCEFFLEEEEMFVEEPCVQKKNFKQSLLEEEDEKVKEPCTTLTGESHEDMYCKEIKIVIGLEQYGMLILEKRLM